VGLIQVRESRQCQVEFAGHCSTEAQVLARAKREYAYDNNQVRKLKGYISDAKEAYNDAKLPPAP
jgi:hypothetical protein